MTYRDNFRKLENVFHSRPSAPARPIPILPASGNVQMNACGTQWSQHSGERYRSQLSPVGRGNSLLNTGFALRRMCLFESSPSRMGSLHPLTPLFRLRNHLLID